MDPDAVANSIKQLVIGSGKFMQEASTFEQAEERILHLEENDDQFHKYDLVKLLKSEIEECIGPIVDEEIENFSQTGREHMSDTDTLVATITEKVTKSRQFAQMKNEITTVVNEAVERLVDNFEDEFRDVNKEDSPPNSPKHRDPYHFSDEESTLSGSYHHGRFFVTHDQLQKNIEHLDKKNNIQTRIAALTDLTHTPLYDVLTSDESHQKEWHYLERGVIDAFCEFDDPVLPKAALKFISRGLAASHGNSKELFAMLLNFLTECCVSNKRRVPNLRDSLDVKRSDVSCILAAVRLMNDFQKLVPNYWVRFSIRYVYDILDMTLRLLSLSTYPGLNDQLHHSKAMTPVHYIALLDPMAEWFIHWTHGCYSRLPLFIMIENHKGFLESMVRSILDYVSSRKVPFDAVSETSDNVSSYRGTMGSHQQKRTVYSGEELEYLYFVHALNIVGRILIYKQGIKLFPIKVKGYDEKVTVTHLICNIVQLMTIAGHSSRSLTAIYDPAHLAADILRKLCSSEATYQTCMCRDEVTNALLAPVKLWIDSNTPEGLLASDGTLLNVADILSIMASRNLGRCHLLYGERGDTFSRTRSSAAHCLTDFCKKAINNALPAHHGTLPKPVAAAYLFLCRQLYNNGEGLQALYSYDLHTVIGKAWVEAAKAVNVLTPEPPNRLFNDKIWWEEILKDNLLNFATTPKGVLLMQQSGAMQTCIEYMCKRHNQRLQVSRLEKFGYGSIMTQIAGTACGMLELDKYGLISMHCLDAWNSVEPGEELDVPFQPKVWSVDKIENSSHKPLVNLLHVFSNFSSIFELIGGEKLPSRTNFSFRDKPSTPIDILNRLVIIDTSKDEAKIHYLFNYEQSHTFGLCLLNSLVSCLDTFLLLESQFKVVDTLLASQTAEEQPNSGSIVLDQLSLLRNHILARCLMVGGPSERSIPPHTLSNNHSNSLGFPFIQSTSVPNSYVPNLTGKSSLKQVKPKSQENDLSRFLNAEGKSGQYDQSWLERCRKHFSSVLLTKAESVKANVLLDALDKTVTALTHIKEEAIFSTASTDSESGAKAFKLTTLQEQGVKKAVKYGIHLKLISSAGNAEENLTKLLRHSGYLLKQQQRQVGSHLRSLNHNYVGFDWFVATIFLMMKGDYERSWKFIQSFSNLSASAYLWSPRLHRSIHLPANIASSSVSPILYSSCHNIELLLQVELPLVYPAFRMSGFTASQICQLWIRQCFWNFLDWQEICTYITLCTVMGIDYQVYMCVAVLKHLQKDILLHQQQQDLIIFLRDNPIHGFKISEQLGYMQRLEKSYRKTVLADMLNFSRP